VQIAAILTVPAEDPARRYLAGLKGKTQDETCPYARLNLLGASLLDRTLSKLRAIGTLPPTVLSDRNIADQVLPSHSARSSAFMEAWEKAVFGYVHGGAEMLVLVRIGAYSDVAYPELLAFHVSTGSPLTQVYGADGSLDIAVVNATLLQNTDGLMRRALSHLIPRQKRFPYGGYVNRLRGPQDLHCLMQDALHGRCGLRPLGNETQPGVWCADDVELDVTVKVHAPVFIGREARVAQGCTISGPSSIEADCQIDCATLIEDSLVLQGTYVGVALDLRHGIAGNNKIFNLDRNVEVSVSDERLIGRCTKPTGIFSGLTSLLFSEAPTGD
jgi:hypothetical protein